MNNRKAHECDLKSLKLSNQMFTNNGIKNFTWPINREECRQALSSYMHFLPDFYMTHQHQDLWLLEILNSLLIVYLGGLYEGSLLKQRTSKNIILPNHTTSWQTLFSNAGSQLLLPIAIERLEQGLVLPTFKRWLRIFKSKKMSNGMMARPIMLVPNKDVIVSTGISPLIHLHTETTNKPIYLCPLYEWFYPLEKKERKRISTSQINSELVHAYTNAVDKLFKDHDCTISTAAKQGLYDWVTTMAGYIRVYAERVRKKPQHIPRQLWIGSSGILWNRLLAHEVRQSDGSVVGHDHAMGSNFSKNNYMSMVEMRDVDCFMTFSEPYANSLRASHRRLNPDKPCPALLYPNKNQSLKKKISKVKPKKINSASKPTKTILYIQPMMRGDLCGPSPLMPDLVAADWQVRLWSQLLKFGYQILVKPHPETKTNFNQSFFSDHGVKIIYEKFEDVYHQGDILLYDYTMTTTFGTGLLTDLPVTLIDFGYTELDEEYLQLLKKRCAIITGHYDKDNRAQVDWQLLKQGLTDSLFLSDTSYTDLILEGH